MSMSPLPPMFIISWFLFLTTTTPKNITLLLSPTLILSMFLLLVGRVIHQSFRKLEDLLQNLCGPGETLVLIKTFEAFIFDTLFYGVVHWFYFFPVVRIVLGWKLAYVMGKKYGEILCNRRCIGGIWIFFWGSLNSWSSTLNLFYKCKRETYLNGIEIERSP